MEFQSTQPSQAVTIRYLIIRDKVDISIHTALAGCDLKLPSLHKFCPISIHTALAGCDSNNLQQKQHCSKHNHTQWIYI